VGCATPRIAPSRAPYAFQICFRFVEIHRDVGASISVSHSRRRRCRACRVCLRIQTTSTSRFWVFSNARVWFGDLLNLLGWHFVSLTRHSRCRRAQGHFGLPSLVPDPEGAGIGEFGDGIVSHLNFRFDREVGPFLQWWKVVATSKKFTNGVAAWRRP